MCREINWNFTLFCIKINKVLFTHQICIVISVSFSYAPSHIIIKLAVIFHPHPQRSRAKARQTLYPLWCHQINYATTLPLIFNQLLATPTTTTMTTSVANQNKRRIDIDCCATIIINHRRPVNPRDHLPPSKPRWKMETPEK